MGLKEEAVQGIGFKRLAIFRSGIIGGNKHSPGYVEWLIRSRMARHSSPHHSFVS